MLQQLFGGAVNSGVKVVWGCVTLCAVLVSGCSEEPILIEGLGPSNGPPFALDGGDYYTVINGACADGRLGLYSTASPTGDSDNFRGIHWFNGGYLYGVDRGKYYFSALVAGDCAWSVSFEPVK